MGALNKRGVWVPSSGDGLLAGWNTMASQLGVYLPVASMSAAKVALNEALAAGMGASSSKPIMFLVGSGIEKVLYVADGTKTGGKWNLAPVNEVQRAEDSYRGGVFASLTQFQFSTMITSALPTAPFDRFVNATAYAYGKVTAGRVNLGLRIGSAADQAEARFASGGVEGSASVSNSGIVKANTAPVIALGVVGDHPTETSTISLGTHDKLSRLKVVAFPVTMEV